MVQVVSDSAGTFGWITTNTLGEVVDFGFEKCPTEEWAWLEGTATADFMVIEDRLLEDDKVLFVKSPRWALVDENGVRLTA